MAVDHDLKPTHLLFKIVLWDYNEPTYIRQFVFLFRLKISPNISLQCSSYNRQRRCEMG